MKIVKCHWVLWRGRQVGKSLPSGGVDLWPAVTLPLCLCIVQLSTSRVPQEQCDNLRQPNGQAGTVDFGGMHCRWPRKTSGETTTCPYAMCNAHCAPWQCNIRIALLMHSTTFSTTYQPLLPNTTNV